jgi:V8-like Glu-specific endopeptidase
VGRSSAFGGRGAHGTLEKEVTLDVARRVAARLGGEAQLTRTSDQNLPLRARAQQAARAGADVFVSLHADSGRADAQGGETWVHPEAGADSRALALGIQRSLDRLGGRYGGSGSTLEGRMAVLSPAVLGARASACLVEIDNLSSARGEQRLRDPAYRQAVGDAIAGAIRSHLDRSRMGGARAVAAATNPQVGWIDPEIDYSKGLAEVNKAWTDWFTKYELWQAPVKDTTYFPHSAICQLTMTDAAGNQAYGTGFFIGKNRILTCGHNFLYAPKGWQATKVRVSPGQNGNDKPFGTSNDYSVASNVSVHADYRTAFNAGNYSRDFDLAVIRVDGFPAPGNLYFDIIEENQSRNIVLCGYGQSSELEPFKQYMDGGYVAQLVGDEVLNYPIMMRPGHSGSPVFRDDSMEVIAVNTFALPNDDFFNYGCRLTEKKIKWIRSC